MKNHTGAAELYNHELSGKVIACAIQVHRILGPGLLESAYQSCLAHEMRIAGLSFDAQRAIPIYYKGERLDCVYRLDFCVENLLILEIKAVETLLGIHHAQLLTYMKLTKSPLGLLLNFNVKLLRDGIKKCAISDFSARSAAPV